MARSMAAWLGARLLAQLTAPTYSRSRAHLSTRRRCLRVRNKIHGE